MTSQTIFAHMFGLNLKITVEPVVDVGKAFVQADARVCLAVEDDGVGFDPMRTFGPDHQGLTNMRERAELLGGTLLIERRPGGGTRVGATIPMADGAVA